MHANTVWGIFQTAIAFFLAYRGMNDPVYLWLGIACLVTTPIAFAWPLIQSRLMPRPVISSVISKYSSAADPLISKLYIEIYVMRGLLFWINRIKDSRLFLIRKDWGHLPSLPPGGIYLKWIVDGVTIDELEMSLKVGVTYRALAIERDDTDGIAYVANEDFIDRGYKKWELPPEREYPRSQVGRYEFWLEVGQGSKRWRTPHYYAVSVPPAGAGDAGFVAQHFCERKDA